jgi:hypothetical protein
VSLVDVDLDCPGVRVEVVAEDATRRRTGCSDGAARTVADWLRKTGGLAGINGGFFGREVGRERKEIVGLLRMEGEQYARAPRYWDRSGEGATGGRGDGATRRTVAFPGPVPSSLRSPIAYAHSALGFDAEQQPAIDWVVSDPHRPTRLLAFEQAELPADLEYRISDLALGGTGSKSQIQNPISRIRPWDMRFALSGGPRLIARGEIAVSDRDERLKSSGLLPRTFVGYAGDRDGVGPRHLVLGAATAMTFQDAARFLAGYFRRFHGVACAEAMALDGGPSSQLAYRADGMIYEAQTSDVTVPTCVIVHGENSPEH